MISFEDAKIYCNFIHYFIFISLVLIACFIKYSGIINSILRFYAIVVIWATVCYLNSGCPLTDLENHLSCNWFGIEFYQNYGFNQTDIKKLITWPHFWYPGIVALLIYVIKNKYRDA